MDPSAPSRRRRVQRPGGGGALPRLVNTSAIHSTGAQGVPRLRVTAVAHHTVASVLSEVSCRLVSHGKRWSSRW